jgi:hypothetical protein
MTVQKEEREEMGVKEARKHSWRNYFKVPLFFFFFFFGHFIKKERIESFL